MSKITAKYLRKVLNYDLHTGLWTRRITRGRHGCHRAGEQAGHINKDGYTSIRLDNKLYLGHRLAWLYMTGKWPKRQVDHKDLDPGNNRWNNLREALHGQNVQNSSLRKNNLSGYKGVRLLRRHGYNLNRPYVARITINKKQIYLGCFSTAQEAHAAYMQSAKIHFGVFARAK